MAVEEKVKKGMSRKMRFVLCAWNAGLIDVTKEIVWSARWSLLWNVVADLRSPPECCAKVLITAVACSRLALGSCHYGSFMLWRPCC